MRGGLYVKIGLRSTLDDRDSMPGSAVMSRGTHLLWRQACSWLATVTPEVPVVYLANPLLLLAPSRSLAYNTCPG